MPEGPWLKINDKVWVAEDSSFGRNNSLNRNCPGCGAEGTLFGFTPQRNKQMEIDSWKKTCPCGAELEIFND